MDFDSTVKLTIYRYFAATGLPPTAREVASVVGSVPDTIQAAYQRLFARRVLVLNPDGNSIRMAPPFSGIPTQHRVQVEKQQYYANCAWDALGVLAALNRDGTVYSRCEQSLDPLTISVRGGQPHPEPCVIHFAVPAAHWWDDIVHT